MAWVTSWFRPVWDSQFIMSRVLVEEMRIDLGLQCTEFSAPQIVRRLLLGCP